MFEVNEMHKHPRKTDVHVPNVGGLQIAPTPPPRKPEVEIPEPALNRGRHVEQASTEAKSNNP
jgi:hypothetical protein